MGDTNKTQQYYETLKKTINPSLPITYQDYSKRFYSYEPFVFLAFLLLIAVVFYLLFYSYKKTVSTKTKTIFVNLFPFALFIYYITASIIAENGILSTIIANGGSEEQSSMEERLALVYNISSTYLMYGVSLFTCILLCSILYSCYHKQQEKTWVQKYMAFASIILLFIALCFLFGFATAEGYSNALLLYSFSALFALPLYNSLL